MARSAATWTSPIAWLLMTPSAPFKCAVALDTHAGIALRLKCTAHTTEAICQSGAPARRTCRGVCNALVPPYQCRRRTIKLVVSGIVFSTVVAGCASSMTAAEHRREAQRYQTAAQLAENRGSMAEVSRNEELATQHEEDAVKQEERDLEEGAPLP